jgi:hypothetical protein
VGKCLLLFTEKFAPGGLALLPQLASVFQALQKFIFGSGVGVYTMSAGFLGFGSGAAKEAPHMVKISDVSPSGK